MLLAFFAFVGYQGGGGLVGALVTMAFIVMLFFSVLLHEFGHSLIARRLGIKVRDIMLLPIGGVSNIRTPPERPSEEVKITVAGPLVNVVLALSSSAWGSRSGPTLQTSPTPSSGALARAVSSSPTSGRSTYSSQSSTCCPPSRWMAGES